MTSEKIVPPDEREEDTPETGDDAASDEKTDDAPESDGQE